MLTQQGAAAGEHFQLVEDPGLQGTLSVILRSPRPITLAHPAVVLRHRGKQCAALVEAVEGTQAEPQILVDGQLKAYLAGSASSPSVSFTAFAIEPAKWVELQIAARLAGQTSYEAWIKKRLLGKPLTQGLEFKLYALLGGEAHEVPVRVAATEPSPFAQLDRDTEVTFKPLTRERESVIGTRWSDIGGLDKAVITVRELVEFPMRYHEVMAEIGIEPPKGILLYGPPGTGKTLIARALANELDAHFFFIQGPEILSAYLSRPAGSPATRKQWLGPRPH